MERSSDYLGEKSLAKKEVGMEKKKKQRKKETTSFQVEAFQTRKMAGWGNFTVRALSNWGGGNAGLGLSSATVFSLA